MENINSLTRDDLKAYVAEHYTGPRMVVAAAGAVDHSQLVQLAESKFGSLRGGEANSLTETAPEHAASFTGSDIRVRFDDMGKAHVAVAFEGVGWTSPYAFPLMVMQVRSHFSEGNILFLLVY